MKLAGGDGSRISSVYILVVTFLQDSGKTSDGAGVTNTLLAINMTGTLTGSGFL